MSHLHAHGKASPFFHPSSRSPIFFYLINIHFEAALYIEGGKEVNELLLGSHRFDSLIVEEGVLITVLPEKDATTQNRKETHGEANDHKTWEQRRAGRALWNLFMAVYRQLRQPHVDVIKMWRRPLFFLQPLMCYGLYQYCVGGRARTGPTVRDLEPPIRQEAVLVWLVFFIIIFFCSLYSWPVVEWNKGSCIYFFKKKNCWRADDVMRCSRWTVYRVDERRKWQASSHQVVECARWDVFGSAMKRAALRVNITRRWRRLYSLEAAWGEGMHVFL